MDADETSVTCYEAIQRCRQLFGTVEHCSAVHTDASPCRRSSPHIRHTQQACSRCARRAHLDADVDGSQGAGVPGETAARAMDVVRPALIRYDQLCVLPHAASVRGAKPVEGPADAGQSSPARCEFCVSTPTHDEMCFGTVDDGFREVLVCTAGCQRTATQ